MYPISCFRGKGFFQVRQAKAPMKRRHDGGRAFGEESFSFQHSRYFLSVFFKIKLGLDFFLHPWQPTFQQESQFLQLAFQFPAGSFFERRHHLLPPLFFIPQGSSSCDGELVYKALHSVYTFAATKQRCSTDNALPADRNTAIIHRRGPDQRAAGAKSDAPGYTLRRPRRIAAGGTPVKRTTR